MLPALGPWDLLLCSISVSVGNGHILGERFSIVAAYQGLWGATCEGTPHVNKPEGAGLGSKDQLVLNRPKQF